MNHLIRGFYLKWLSGDIQNGDYLYEIEDGFYISNDALNRIKK